MNEQALQRYLEDALLAHWNGRPADTAHDAGHVRRVWNISKNIAAEMDAEIDLKALQAASILHDLVNLPKDHPERHLASRQSAKAARNVLEPLGGSARRLDTICHAIEAHSFSAGIAPCSDEARILQDADRLEALGALGIARCFAVSGQLGRALFDGNDPAATKRTLDDTSFALDHFDVKLFRLPGLMNTEPGRRRADARVAFMRSFRQELLNELGADPASGLSK